MCVEEFVKCCVRRHPLLSVLEESILKAYCQATFHGIYRRLDFPFCSSRLIHTIETTYGVRFDKNFFLRVEAATTMETINRSGHTVIPGVCYPTRAGSRTTTAAPVGTTAGNNPHSENPKLEKKPGSIPHSELPEGTTKVTEEDQSGASPTASRAKCGALLVSWKHDEAAGRALIRSLRLRTEVLTALLPPEEEGEGENRAVEI
ncbi:hypothetical protein GNI_049380 [Gregarina niphandrodes]|uniref:Uncharacterized protein n=1 Tax=Gregarina niphandrodes TaxID=110365 RepID=A0A023B9P1_GRENI|nr:hypothetical protein GNI_049380 [Gregarina niphandrodes]EZG73013.1 hypothetical protein GNI_049380 [Gregarina niphandrodes]|eukprot:XP_011129665.1 hypothetical protein GNI_049380 [Gregarina niphandrodes]